ncbi:MAG: RagB/SusD family nutrient uptake outer membrane protein, partial [Cyclobacteriaceae bacterium]|nr:RagB/SusD family nutrient uptake outer membrane protein [Cyclobacteriaceae bacterium]
MKYLIYILLFTILLTVLSCADLLSPKPVDRITDDQVLTDANSARVVLTSAYRDLANLGAPKIIAGDLTADNLIHNGTFTQYREISSKDMSASNGSASALWGVIYSMSYIASFLNEGLPEIDISQTDSDEIIATASFLRAYAYFVGVYTFGGLPIVTTTNVEENRQIPRSSFEETLDFIESDLLFALDKLPEESFNSGEATNGAVKALLARYYLFKDNWSEAEKYASDVIQGNGTKEYILEEEFENAVADFSTESILEIVYSANDNPGTSTNFSINNLFVGRREIIPSSEMVLALQNDGGDRQVVLEFDGTNARGSDNGWTIVRYGPFDNIQLFRLAEMYIIRAEARAQQDNISGTESAESDINVIRERAGVPLIQGTSKNQMLLVIENERRMELCFEGHRWYDLIRTGRAKTVMDEFTSNWSEKDELWPIPLREITNNPSLKDAQNP